MSRFLEATFVIGCSLVGLSMGAPEGSGVHDPVNFSVHFIAAAENNIASNVSHLRSSLCNVPVQVLRSLPQ